MKLKTGLENSEPEKKVVSNNNVADRVPKQ